MIDESEELLERIDDLEECLEGLVTEYVANRGSLCKGEFISCITPHSRVDVGCYTKSQRERSVWIHWDKARRLLGESVPPLPTVKRKWVNGIPQPIEEPK